MDNHIYMLTILLAGLGVTAGLVSCSTEPPEAESQENEETPTVEVIKADTIQRIQQVTYGGNLEAWKQINVGSNTPGRVDRLYVDEGDLVNAGDPLVQMEDRDLAQARLNYEQAQREYERLLPLYKEGSVPRQQLDQAETELETAEINLQIMEENTLLQSNVDGVVTQQWFEEGELYSATPGQAGGAPAIVQVMQQNPLKLQVRVNESYLRFLEEGDEATIQVEALPDEIFESDIYKIYPTIDPATRTFLTEIRIPNDDLRLRPGMFARARLDLQSIEAIFVPREALMRGTSENSRDILFLVDDSSKAVRQNVNVGMFIDQYAIIEQGVRPGQQVIVQGNQIVTDGMTVNTAIRDIAGNKTSHY